MNERTQMVIADVRIPFFRLMLFFIKAGFAAIPAVIVVTTVVTVCAALLAMALGMGPTIVIRRWM